MREAQDQPSYVACEPGPGSPASLLAGPWSHIQGRPQNLFLQKKKKKKIWEHTPKKPSSAVNRVPGFCFVTFALKHALILTHREPLLALRFTASSMQDRPVPKRASQDPGTGPPAVHPCLSWGRHPVSSLSSPERSTPAALSFC